MFHWVELRAYCHATEEESRVVEALRTLVPEREVRREALAGHFGNPLVVLTARVDKAAEMKALWRDVAGALGKEALLADMDARIDEDGIYHLRIDKQAAYRGRIAKAVSDDVIAVRAKVAAYPNRAGVAADTLRAFLGGL